MNRRTFLRWALGAAGVLALPRGLRGADAGAARPPNFLFILADDLGWGDLGCYGNREIRTPCLDRLASQGTLFTQCYVAGSVCSPSRAAFLTSRFPAELRLHGHLATHAQNEARAMPDWLDPAVPTLPRALKAAGYVTGHIGKWHLGNGPGAPEPLAYGFDFSRAVNAPSQTWDEGKDPDFRARSTALFVDEAIGFIEAHRDRPFYLQVWTLLTHATLKPTEEQMVPYARFGAGRGVPFSSPWQVYYASATDLDTQIGRLIRRLDELGLAENTVVIFSSDNGPEDMAIGNARHSGVGSAGPLRGRKRSLYEGGIRVPGIVRWPGHVPAGRVEREAVVSAVDFLPTLAALAGAEVPAGAPVRGEDMTDVLRGASRPRREPLFWEWRFRVSGHVWNRCPMLAIRDGPWKLLLNPDRGRVELYHIPNDPMESDNVADSHPDVVAALADRALAWHKTLPPGPTDPGAGSNAYPWPGSAGGKPPAKSAPGKRG